MLYYWDQNHVNRPHEKKREKHAIGYLVKGAMKGEQEKQTRKRDSDRNRTLRKRAELLDHHK